MLFNLFNLFLTASTSGSGTDGATTPQETNPWPTYIIMGVFLVLIVVFMVLSKRSQKKKQEETNAMLDAIAPGNKVKTIGGICGVVVEVCKEDNTFILETGSEESGKSYIKFDKQSVYQTDATPNRQASAPSEETAPEAPVEDVFTETAPEAPATEEDPATEEKAE